MPFPCPSRTSIEHEGESCFKAALVALASATPIFAETPIAPATSDWTQDAPGVRHKITVDDLPAPYATGSALNNPRVVRRPPGGQLHVPPGFKSEEYASGFVYPRFLLTAPNGDIFVTESRADTIKLLRGRNGDGKPDVTDIFADRDMNDPFGIAFYPPGPEPQFLYVANTNGVIRFPYRNGDTKLAVRRKDSAPNFPAVGCCAGAAIGHATLSFLPMAKRCTSPSAHIRMYPILREKPIAHASSSSIRTERGEAFLRGGSATPSGSRSVQAQMSFG